MSVSQQHSTASEAPRATGQKGLAMSHITIECPDCKIEHTKVWRVGTFCSGEFVCGCSTIIAYRVQLVARGTARDPHREESEAKRG